MATPSGRPVIPLAEKPPAQFGYCYYCKLALNDKKLIFNCKGCAVPIHIDCLDSKILPSDATSTFVKSKTIDLWYFCNICQNNYTYLRKTHNPSVQAQKEKEFSDQQRQLAAKLEEVQLSYENCKTSHQDQTRQIQVLQQQLESLNVDSKTLKSSYDQIVNERNILRRQFEASEQKVVTLTEDYNKLAAYNDALKLSNNGINLAVDSEYQTKLLESEKEIKLLEEKLKLVTEQLAQQKKSSAVRSNNRGRSDSDDVADVIENYMDTISSRITEDISTGFSSVLARIEKIKKELQNQKKSMAATYNAQPKSNSIPTQRPIGKQTLPTNPAPAVSITYAAALATAHATARLHSQHYSGGRRGTEVKNCRDS